MCINGPCERGFKNPLILEVVWLSSSTLQYVLTPDHLQPLQLCIKDNMPYELYFYSV